MPTPLPLSTSSSSFFSIVMFQRSATLGTRCNRPLSTPHTAQRLLALRSSRRLAHSRQFQPLVPPSPESLGRAQKARHYPRTAKWLRRLLYLSASLGAGYALDRHFYASSLARSARTFGLGLFVALDYKMNFRERPWVGGSIADLHRRSAERLFGLLRENGGLYLKIGYVRFEQLRRPA
jgi:aarF domain-containing kinase